MEHAKEGDVTVTIRPDHIELLNEGDEFFRRNF